MALKTKVRGRRAAKSGQYGEQTAQGIFEAAGWPVVNYKKDMPILGSRVIRQYPVPHPFKSGETRSGRNDFMIEASHRVYVQVKNQNSHGTTDEKIAFTWDYASYCMTDDPFDEFWLVLLGTWWTDGMVEYSRRKCHEFEFLNRRVRKEVSAQVIRGPLELAVAVRNLKR